MKVVDLPFVYVSIHMISLKGFLKEKIKVKV
jgi:hypothetical protein